MAGNKTPASIDELEFVPRDMDIFRIPDLRTRVDTLQKYFFPRLEVLLCHTLSAARDVFSRDPFRECSFVYHPSPRDETEQPTGCGTAFMGISGKRRTDRQLRFEREDGSRLYFHPAHLYFEIESRGSIRAVLEPFRYSLASRTIQDVARLFKDHASAINQLLLANQIAYTNASVVESLAEAVLSAEGPRRLFLFSPSHHLPVTQYAGLDSTVAAFMAMYPLFEVLIRFGEGDEQDLESSIRQFAVWNQGRAQHPPASPSEPEASLGPLELPELDNYKFVRASVWWGVLCRDKWTCLSCGRTAKDGVTLEVDHILPRSKGGKDDVDNLQTLCRKYNVGKSNRDNTDLR